MKILSMDDMTRKLLELKDDCMYELDSIGLADMIGEIETWYVDKRATRRLGVCKHRKSMGYVYNNIGISSWLLKDFDEKTIKNTIIHEILHTFEGCNNHGYKWQKYADIVNTKLGYNIKRLSSLETICENNDIDYNKYENVHYKYKGTCKKCGYVWHQQRLSSHALLSYKLGRMTHSVCGGHEFEIIDTKSGVKIV